MQSSRSGSAGNTSKSCLQEAFSQGCRGKGEVACPKAKRGKKRILELWDSSRESTKVWKERMCSGLGTSGRSSTSLARAQDELNITMGARLKKGRRTRLICVCLQSWVVSARTNKNE